MNNSLYQTEKRITFIVICLIAFALLWVKKDFIEYETATFEFLEDRPEGGILRLFTMLQFIAIPIVFLWKFLVTAFVLWVGCFTFGYRVTFEQCWSIVMGAEFIFFLSSLLEIGWFLFFYTDPTLYEVRNFYPLSLMNFFNPETVANRYAYPLRAINVFEVIYIFILVDGVHFYARRPRKTVWRVIAYSYLLLFILWLGFYMVVYK